MNAEINNVDPFAAMMRRRVKTITIEGWPEFQLREAPMAEVEPLLYNNDTLPPQEFCFQLIGLSIWIGDHRGSADMLKRMGPSALNKLVEAIQADIFDLYNLKAAEAPDGEAKSGNGTASPPPRRGKKKG